MDRKMKTVCALLVLLVLCAGGYAALRWWNGAQAAQAADTADYVLKLENISALSWTRNGTTLSFTKGADSTWTSGDTPDLPLEQSPFTALADTLSALAADKVISDPEGDASYGLDAPALRVEAAYDGGTAALLVGAAVNGSYYAKVEGAPTVYTIPDSLMTGTDYALLDLVALDTIPTFTESTVESVALSVGGNTWLLTREERTAEPEESAAPDTAGEPETVTVWSLNGAELPEEDGARRSAVSALPGLSFTACHAYAPDAAALAACGLANPARLTVTYSGGSYTLLIGGTDASGSYYAMLEGSQQLNLITAAAGSALLGLPGSK